MADNSTLIIVSAFSGMAGAILTQIITATNTYFIDKRKQSSELETQYRNKKVEIAENYYYLSGEKLVALKKNITYWKNWNNSRSQTTLKFLAGKTKSFNDYMDKLNADNWKYNLISLYFNISFTNEEMARSNEKSHQLYLTYLDLSDKLQTADDEDKESLYQKYALTVFDMCSNYEEIYGRLENDMFIIKEQVLLEFKLS